MVSSMVIYFNLKGGKMIKYRGPGNSWDVKVRKSAVTGGKAEISDVKFRTACTFIKTHKEE